MTAERHAGRAATLLERADEVRQQAMNADLAMPDGRGLVWEHQQLIQEAQAHALTAIAKTGVRAVRT